jgi:hypothetical protein
VPGSDSVWEVEAGRWQSLHYGDSIGDAGPGVPWLDIARVGHGGSGPPYFCIHLAGERPDSVHDPATRWIAYGFVLDTNGDGEPDVRIGMDYVGAAKQRAWSTDLRSGQTSGKIFPPFTSFGSRPEQSAVPGIIDWYHPHDDVDANGGKIYYSARAGTPMPRAYAWASMIEEGRVVATDFAPDVGWLVEPPRPT